MAKDQTEVGITGQPVPKPKTAKQQYELEKKRRMEKHLGRNVGGTQYRSDVNPYSNPRARTYREFVELCEAVYGGEAEQPKDTRKVVTAADKKGNTPAWQNYQAGHKGYKAAAHLQNSSFELEGDLVDEATDDPIDVDFKPQRLPNGKSPKPNPQHAAAIAAALKLRARVKASKKVDEGYVDWEKGSLTIPSRVQGNKKTQSPKERAGSSQFRKMADAQTTRGTQGKIGKKGRLARLAAKQQDVIQTTTQKYRQDKN